MVILVFLYDKAIRCNLNLHICIYYILVLTLTSYIKSLDLYANAQIDCSWHSMEAMAVDETIWHGMKVSEVDGSRSVVRNLKSFIYEIKL